MLRLIGLVALLVIVWLAISQGYIQRLEPHIERALVLLKQVASDMKRNVQEKDRTQEPENGYDSQEEQIPGGEDPYRDRINAGRVTEEFSEKTGAEPVEETAQELAVEGKSLEPVKNQRRETKRGVFFDGYEEARRKLLEAMTILDGGEIGG